MTPEENIKIVQSAYAAFGRGDIGALLGLLDEQVEWVTPESVPQPAAGKLKGREQVAGFFASVGAAWEFESFEAREFVASGDRVMALGYSRAKSRATGRMATVDWMMAFRLSGGKVVHFQESTDTAVLRDALAAA